MTLQIDYVSEDFTPDAPVTNGTGMLNTSWDELLWAAITVGRPNRQYVFRHGDASLYEALFRLSLVRMALEQNGPAARRLRRTTAARTLDPSEKGAVNYFLGLTICKLFASQLLEAPWLLHLDVFRPLLNPILTGRSRPDLVGITKTGYWVALECKGRVSTPNERAKTKAKEQARRLKSVNGIDTTFKIGGIAYFKDEVLRFYWQDPQPDPFKIKKSIEVELHGDEWRHYYAPAFDLIRAHPSYLRSMLHEHTLMPVENADIKIGIHPTILRLLIDSKWKMARKALIDPEESSIPYRMDGIALVAGQSWEKPYKEAL